VKGLSRNEKLKIQDAKSLWVNSSVKSSRTESGPPCLLLIKNLKFILYEYSNNQAEKIYFSIKIKVYRSKSVRLGLI
jgi:hypothetical protein